MAHNTLGNAYQLAGEMEKAIAQFQKAISISPNLAPLHYNLANALTKALRLDEAIVEYQNALNLNANYAEAQNGLGIAFAEKGDMSSALGHFKEAVRLKPGYAEAKNNLAKAQAAVNHSDLDDREVRSVRVNHGQRTCDFRADTVPLARSPLGGATGDRLRVADRAADFHGAVS